MEMSQVIFLQSLNKTPVWVLKHNKVDFTDNNRLYIKCVRLPVTDTKHVHRPVNYTARSYRDFAAECLSTQTSWAGNSVSCDVERTWFKCAVYHSYLTQSLTSVTNRNPKTRWQSCQYHSVIFFFNLIFFLQNKYGI